MLHRNFVHFVGRQLEEAIFEIEDDFFGHVVVLAPSEALSTHLQPARLQVLVDDKNFIIKIING